MEELNLDELEKDINNNNAVKDKFVDVLKHKKAAEEKAETESKARKEAEDKLAEMEKETKFLNSYAEGISKYPQATEYKDRIKEKVATGYTFDDAAISILVAEGKYTPPAKPIENVAGGSASNQITQNPAKTSKEMSQAERWDALKEAERRGDIGLT